MHLKACLSSNAGAKVIVFFETAKRFKNFFHFRHIKLPRITQIARIYATRSKIFNHKLRALGPKGRLRNNVEQELHEFSLPTARHSDA
jgi:hypothetical protein